MELGTKLLERVQLVESVPFFFSSSVLVKIASIHIDLIIDAENNLYWNNGFIIDKINQHTNWFPSENIAICK